jgi:MFS family permease
MSTLARANPYEPPQLSETPPPVAPQRLPGELSTAALCGMVVLAALAMAATLPGRTHGLGLITEGLLADLRLDRSDFAQVNLVATLVGALFCLPCGWLLDRLGMRLVSALVLVLLGVATLGIATTHSIPMLWLWVTLTRGLGQSMLSVVSITLVGKASLGPRHPWAMAAYSVLVSLLFIAAFSIMGKVIPAAGWRTAWLGLGWTVVILGPAFALLIVEPAREVAEVARLQTNGKRELNSGEFSYENLPSPSATLWQALAAPAFWVFALTSSLYALVSSGLSLFNQSILAERHFEAGVFYALLSISTLAGLVSNLAAGYLARHISYGRLMAGAMTLYTLALLAFPLVTQLWQVYAYGIAMGLCGGVVTVVFFGVWSQAFGGEHLGKIQGLAQAATVVASAAGPLAFAACLQRFGSYSPAFWIIAPGVGLLAVAAWLIPTPNVATARWKTIHLPEDQK